MRKSIKRIWNAVTTVLVGVVVLLAALIWGFRLLGMDVFVVQSASMEPAYHVGSLVYVKPVDATELQNGDVITFRLGGGARGTHRIIEVMEEGDFPTFRTKGDANDHPDNHVITPADIVGKVQFTIPYLGFLITYIQQPPGTYVALSAVAMILLLTILPDVIFREEKIRITRRKPYEESEENPADLPVRRDSGHRVCAGHACLADRQRCRREYLYGRSGGYYR